MKISISFLTSTLLLACASRRGKSDEPWNSWNDPVPELKVVGHSFIQIDNADDFSMHLEIVDSSQKNKYDFNLECDSQECMKHISLSKSGLLRFSSDFRSSDERIHFVVKLTDSNGSSRSSKKHFFSAKKSFFGYQSGDLWHRIFSGSSQWDSVRGLGSIVVAQRTGVGSQLSVQDRLKQAGSAIYLGEYLGVHLILTAQHVFDSELVNGASTCDSNRFYSFEELSLDFTCTNIIWQKSGYDFVLLAVQPQDQILKFPGLQKCLELDSEPQPGHRIALAGYGTYRNLARNLGVSSDEECRILRDGRVRVKTDSEEILNYFVSACDVSDGDSGGPLIDRESGKVVALITGGNAMLKKTPSSADLKSFVSSASGDVMSVANVVSVLLKDVFAEIKNTVSAESEAGKLVEEVYRKNRNLECSLIR